MSLKRTLRLVVLILSLALLACPGTLAEAAGTLSFTTDYQGIDDAAQSVLMLYWEDAFYAYSGSAFVAFEEDMLITNYHVIEGAQSEIFAYSDSGEEYVIDRVFAADKDKDLAIVGFSEPTGIPPLSLGDTQGLLRAEPVVAIGSPQGQKNTVSLGNVSGMFEEEGVHYVQFTAPISHGSSGGALFDNRGNVIGITSAYIVDSQNLNLAVDICEAKALYAQIEDREGLSFKDYWRSERRENEKKAEQAYGDFAGRNFRPESVVFFWCDRGQNINFLSTEKTGFTQIAYDELQDTLLQRDYYATLTFSMDASDSDTRLDVELELTTPGGWRHSSVTSMHFIAAERQSAKISSKISGLMSYVIGGGTYTLRYKVDGQEIASSTFEVIGTPAAEDPAPIETPAPQETPTPRPTPESTPEPVETPEPTRAPSTHIELQPGDQGEDVRRMQEALIALGYLPEGSADGVYGSVTQSAVRSFQRVNGLRGVFYGTADAKTLERLYSDEALPYGDPDVVLSIDDKTNLDWYGQGANCQMCFQVRNDGRTKTVTAYTVHYTINNTDGEVESEGTVTLKQTIAPGETVASSLIDVAETDKSYEIYIGITSVTYDDGTTVEIERPQYVGWWM